MSKVSKEQFEQIYAKYWDSDKVTVNDILTLTGWSYEEYTDYSFELLFSGRLFILVEEQRKLAQRGGIYKIHPYTFNIKHYENLKGVRDDGFRTSNVVASCNQMDSLCGGYLWRFADQVDTNNIKQCIMQQIPHLFIPVKSVNVETGEECTYSSIQLPNLLGFRRCEIMEVINGKKKSYKGFYWYHADTSNDCTNTSNKS